MASAEVKWSHFCDYAFLDQGGKVCVIGVFDNISVVQVPCQHTRCAFVFEIRGNANQNVAVNLRLVRPDGKEPLVNLFNPALDLGPNGGATVVIGLDNLTLPDYGPYEMHVLINGQLAHIAEFTVTKVPGVTRP